MAKQNVAEQETLGEAMNKTELFFERNGRTMSYVFLGLLVLAALVFGYRSLILQPRATKAAEMIAEAQNRFEGRQQFHPREREDCGYVLTIGGTRIYIAGDGENTPEMKALHGIDIAFLPVNQPYTMTVDQAVDAVKAIRPAIFYPYHYGEVEEKTDIDRLSRELTDVTEIRIRPME